MNYIKIAIQGQRSVSQALHGVLSKYQPARSILNIHASELTKQTAEFCPRQYALYDTLQKKKPDEFLTTSINLVFEQGRQVQDYIAQSLADADALVGNWNCVACKRHYEFQPRPKSCACGCKEFKYDEYRFKDPVSGASCGVDILFNSGAPLLEVTEIKTMQKDDFVKLAAPLAEHRIRTNLYLSIIKNSDSPYKDRVNTSKFRVLYIVKGGYGKKIDKMKIPNSPRDQFSPFLEFELKHEPEAALPFLAKAQTVTEWRADTNPKKELPPRICNSILCKRAFDCPLKNDCFKADLS